MTKIITLTAVILAVLPAAAQAKSTWSIATPDKSTWSATTDRSSLGDATMEAPASFKW